MGWLSNDLTGWGAFGALGLSILGAMVSERLLTRRALARAVAAAEAKAGFFERAYGLERERNQLLTDTVVTIVKEIRAAVADPDRRPQL
jgi:hypothetical protein